MSGTSLDSVDAVLADAEGHDRAFSHQPYLPAVRAQLLAVTRSRPDELRRVALAGNALARVWAQATADVLNLSGIANFSPLPAGGPASGLDCGPGNVLMDPSCQQRLGGGFDVRGAWAARGHVQAAWRSPTATCGRRKGSHEPSWRAVRAICRR